MMTKEEILNQFGSVMLDFSEYDKYTFSFTGEKDGCAIMANFGGCADEIYRFNVWPGMQMSIKDDPTSVFIYKDGKLIGHYQN